MLPRDRKYRVVRPSGLPGIGLARQALRAGDQPLERANFLKGQGANGAFGEISRLARDIGVVDDAGELERAGTGLLLAWAEDQDLSGLLEDEGGLVVALIVLVAILAIRFGRPFLARFDVESWHISTESDPNVNSKTEPKGGNCPVKKSRSRSKQKQRRSA